MTSYLLTSEYCCLLQLIKSSAFFYSRKYQGQDCQSRLAHAHTLGDTINLKAVSGSVELSMIGQARKPHPWFYGILVTNQVISGPELIRHRPINFLKIITVTNIKSCNKTTRETDWVYF